MGRGNVADKSWSLHCYLKPPQTITGYRAALQGIARGLCTAYRPAPARGQHSVSASSWAAQGKSVLVFIYVMFISTFRAKEIAFSSQIVL